MLFIRQDTTNGNVPSVVVSLIFLEKIGSSLLQLFTLAPTTQSCLATKNKHNT